MDYGRGSRVWTLFIGDIKFNNESIWANDQSKKAQAAFIETAAPMLYLPRSGFNPIKADLINRGFSCLTE